MSQFELTEDQIAIQAVARKFTADAITPNAAQWDENHHFPRDTIKAAADLGFAGAFDIGRHQSSDENDCRTRFIAPMTPL